MDNFLEKTLLRSIVNAIFDKKNYIIYGNC